VSARADTARRAVRKVLRDARDKNKWRKIVRFRLWMPVALQFVLILAVAWFASARFPGFINEANVRTILILAAPLAVVAMGQVHALLVGYLDLSVGAMVTFGVVIASFLIPSEATTLQIVLGVGAVFLAGLALGLVNALLVRGFKIPSIIATLATLSILNGVSLTLRPTAGGIIDRDFTAGLGTGVGPVPIVFLLAVGGAAVLDYWLHATGSGLQLRSVGFDERSARRSGVRTTWVRVRALVLSALFAAIGAFLVMARSGVGNAEIGSSYALNSITAAVLPMATNMCPSASRRASPSGVSSLSERLVTACPRARNSKRSVAEATS
jgi:ribose transport system ATP-binding protein